MLNSFKNKYQNIFEECFDEHLTETKEDKEESDYIEPTPYRISTMTLITSFSCNINLEVVSKYFTLDDKIISMVYGDKPVKNSNLKKNNRPFFNQATIIVMLDPLRKINVKIFSNGKIQMTGVKKLEEGHEALKYIIEKLKITEGVIPLEKVLDSQLEKVYLEKREGEHFKESYPIDDTLLYRERLIWEIDKLIDESNLLCHCIEDLVNFKYTDIDIVLINSDFNINFKIKRNILHSILKDEYNLISRFEPGIYPGVNNKFYWNTEYKSDPMKKPGVCYCKKPCDGKGLGCGDGDCKKITIAAFSSGSVIITGARKIEQINDCYDFINKVFKDNYMKVKKISAPFYDEKKEQRNTNKKYIKPSDIIYIDRDSLQNEYNQDIYSEYLEYTK
tara:strand:+ start:104 stop:1273 length:1170 start_codon:yes stop_codon:yes gene_type:complete